MAIGKGDYRPYKGEFKGTSYITSRIYKGNLKSLIRSKWTIIVLVISYLFLFIHIMSFAFGGQRVVVSPEDIFEEMVDMRFRITPADDEDLSREVRLGETLEFYFDVKNTGNDPGYARFFVYTPNSNWAGNASVVNGDDHLNPGESVRVRMDVKVPNDYERFLGVGDVDVYPADEKNGSEAGGHKKVREVSAQFGGSDGLTVDVKDDVYRISPILLGYPSMYYLNISRTITFGASPIEEWEERGGEMIPFSISSDGRTSSVQALISLSKDQVEESLQEMNRTLPEDTGNSRFDIRFLPEDRLPVQTVKGGKSSTLSARIENTGNTTVAVVVDGLVSHYAEDGWRLQTIGLIFEPNTGRPYVILEPGGSVDFEVLINSSENSIRKDYNIILYGTDVLHPYYQASDIDLAVMRVDEVKTNDRAKELMYELLWGGGIYYERYLWLILLCSIAGAGLIANDVRYNSISLYLSRPFSRWHYIGGKSLALFTVLLLISSLPALLLFISGMAFSSVDLRYIFGHLWILGSMQASLLMTLILLVSVSLAFSSLTRRWIYAGAGLFSFLVFTSTLSDILYALFEVKALKLFNLLGNIKVVSKILYGIDYNASGNGFEWYVPAILLVFLAGISIFLVFRRLKEQEGS